jgi:hypothetical protein
MYLSPFNAQAHSFEFAGDEVSDSLFTVWYLKTGFTKFLENRCCAGRIELHQNRVRSKDHFAKLAHALRSYSTSGAHDDEPLFEPICLSVALLDGLQIEGVS